MSPQQEFEIELEGSQCLRILCYEKCYDKSKLNKIDDDNEIVDKIVGKGQVQVRKGSLFPGLYCSSSSLLKIAQEYFESPAWPSLRSPVPQYHSATSGGFPSESVLLLSKPFIS